MTAKELKEHRKLLKERQCLKCLPEIGIPNFGDITQITDDDLRALGRVDVLEGGSPCQAFSMAGKKEGLEDARGNLMLEFCRLADRMKEINGLRYVVWENVKGVLSNEKGKAFGCLLAALVGEDSPIQPPRKGWRAAGFANRAGTPGAVSYRVLDAQFFGVPQRRDRVFVVADFADRRGDSGAILFESKSENRFTSQVNNQPGQGIATVDENSFVETNPANDNRLVNPQIVGTLMASGAGMDRHAGMGNELDFIIVQILDGQLITRRLHPVECERLMGFPDDWTNVRYALSRGRKNHDKRRYGTLGNSMAAPCMRYIGIGLLEYHQEQLALSA